MAVAGSPHGPRVSVVMPVHNEQRYVAGAVDSIVRQSYRDWELVIVDDASTDATPLLLSKLDDARVRVIRPAEKAAELGTTLNVGLAAATGEFVARMDADDVSDPNRLALQVDFLARHPDVGLVGSWAASVDADGRTTGLATTPVDDVAIKWQLNYRNPLHHPSVMIRRALLERLGGYDPGKHFAEDYDLFCRLAACAELHSLPVPLISKRLHDVSASIRHDEVQDSVAVEISMAMLTSRLPRPPDPTVVRALHRRRFRDRGQLVATAQMLRQLERGMRREAAFRGWRRRRALARAAAEAMLSLGRATTDDGRRYPAVKWRALPVAPAYVTGAALGAGVRRMQGPVDG